MQELRPIPEQQLIPPDDELKPGKRRNPAAVLLVIFSFIALVAGAGTVLLLLPVDREPAPSTPRSAGQLTAAENSAAPTPKPLGEQRPADPSKTSPVFESDSPSLKEQSPEQPFSEPASPSGEKETSESPGDHLRLTELYRQAEAAERSGALAQARAILEQILQIAPDYEPAEAALTRLKAQVEEEAFNRQMTIFYKSLASRDSSGAQLALKALKEIDESHSQIKQAEKLLAELKETLLIDSLGTKAESYAKDEKWLEALATYREILALAPDLLLAANGRDIAARRLELDTKLEDLLQNPKRLQDEEIRQTGTELLDYASQIEHRTPRLASQISQLQALVDEMNTEVRLTIESDNQTNITIYHVGNLGRFFSRNLNLTPGTYTVVGSRIGYRDIRRVIEIKTSGDKLLTIICSEPI